MENRRFDAWTRALAKGRGLKGLIGGGAAAFAGVSAVGAQDDDTANAGNGGTATANANGGTVTIGDINAGGNSGNDIVVGDSDGGSVTINGGSVNTTTSLSVSADGGEAFADASGGDGNVAFAS
jgi:hypothetical protein